MTSPSPALGRAARPPKVQGGGLAMADGLLPGRGCVDGLQRQSDLDKLLAVWRGIPPGNVLGKLKILRSGGTKKRSASVIPKGSVLAIILKISRR